MNRPSLKNLIVNSPLFNGENNYNLKSYMYGNTCKGTYTEDRDSVLIETHPSDDELKLMAIASGTGKIDNIDSSKYTTQKIKKWFNETNSWILKEMNFSFKKSVDACMKDISRNLSNANDSNGTSVILAIVGPKCTCVANIGNLRCYISKEGSMINQVNEEDSELWGHYLNDYLTKEDLRFNVDKDENVVKIGLGNHNALGADNFSSFYYLDTTSFDRLYLFSRGIIDSISEDKLNNIVGNNSLKEAIEIIIEQATDGKKESKLNSWNNEFDSIKHGEKDASVCVLAKTKK